MLHRCRRSTCWHGFGCVFVTDRCVHRMTGVGCAWVLSIILSFVAHFRLMAPGVRGSITSILSSVAHFLLMAPGVRGSIPSIFVLCCTFSA